MPVSTPIILFVLAQKTNKNKNKCDEENCFVIERLKSNRKVISESIIKLENENENKNNIFLTPQAPIFIVHHFFFCERISERTKKVLSDRRESERRERRGGT